MDLKYLHYAVSQLIICCQDEESTMPRVFLF
jgi:hypothetical protein